MATHTLLFCGSFMHNSAQVLAGLLADKRFTISGVVTTPPVEIKHQLHPNPVQVLAEQHHLPVFTPEQADADALHHFGQHIGRVDVLLTAGYGKLLPASWLSWPTKAALNLHFSDLPKYRGANPAEWALLMNEHETGITLIEMSPEFDTGKMVAQSTIAITPDDTRESVYDHLYALGGGVVGEMIARYLIPNDMDYVAVAGNHHIHRWQPPLSQPDSPTPYAKRLVRDDGYIKWSSVQAVMQGKLADTADFSPIIQRILTVGKMSPDAVFVERMIRALAGFPGVWSVIPTSKGERRLKLKTARIAYHCLELLTVQIEGQQPATWNQVKNVIE